MVERDWTIKTLKIAISNWNAIPVRQQKLSFRGRELPDGIRLPEYKGAEKCVIQVSRLHIGQDDSGWHPIMEPLELDHFGHLLDKAVNAPLDDELLRYLFERWKNYMARTGSEDIRRVIKVMAMVCN